MKASIAKPGRLRNCVKLIARGEEGSQLVEMCLSLLVLVALLIGTMEFAMGFLAVSEVADAAREGARWAMVRGSTSCSNTSGLSHCNAAGSDVTTYVRGMSLPLLVSTNIGVTTSWLKPTTTTPTSWSTCSSGTCNQPGYEVKVQVTYSLPLLMKFWNSTSNSFAAQTSTLAISDTSTMIISQ
jgi:Flp pilus assembly protein TadG